MSSTAKATPVDTELLRARFLATRRFTERLVEPLSAEDCAVQSMPDVSPTRWHLAHTTWFFETFVLSEQSRYEAFDTRYAYLFNSYYNTVGKQFPRARRGLLTRPDLAEVIEYRRHVDTRMLAWFESAGVAQAQFADVIETGIQHEQQHQELILTDIKHVLGQNPLHPVYGNGRLRGGDLGEAFDWVAIDEGIHWVGHDGNGFSFDNERPRHRQFLESFEIANRLVTCGEYLQFIDDGGYERPELWLSLGWDTVCRERWDSPLYWSHDDDRWHEFTLAGSVPVDPLRPVCHVSYFEADAFARWAGARLPSEAEWEVVSRDVPLDGNFVDVLMDDGRTIHPQADDAATSGLADMFGSVWQWTASPYTAYPGYQAPDGALGEYNGKFMCQQYVLRGGSCATSSTHIRRTYRNFFPPEARWQFTGLRLCR